VRSHSGCHRLCYCRQTYIGYRNLRSIIQSTGEYRLAQPSSGVLGDRVEDAYCSTYTTPEEEKADGKSKRLTGMDRWQSHLIQIIWKHMIALWKLRNDECHGRDKETRELARHTVLTNKLKVLYLNSNQYPPVVQNILKTS
jgi:hypothetical protein